MRFHFSLEELLHIRRLLEQQSRERLDHAMMRIRTLERNLAQAEQWSEKTARIRSSKKYLPAIEVQFVESVLGRTREAIAHCRQQKKEEEQRAAELRALYLLARRERKTVSTLREDAHRQFEVEQSRREQSEMDEIFLEKLLRSRDGLGQASTGVGTAEINDRNLT